MKDLAKKVAVGLSTAALLSQSLLVPAFAEIQVVVTGNGSDTTNSANVTQENTTVVDQTNTANISNDIDANANTGGNNADDNTGGNVDIDTGNAQTEVAVSNTVNSNEAHVDCGGCPTNVDVTISGNGTRSDNNVDLDLENETFVTQDNTANIDNNVDVKAKTGYNSADDNTGGSVSIDTGSAKAVAVVDNKANANTAWVGGNGEGALNLWITGNGSNSDSDIDVDLKNAVVLDQTNWADIDNDVEVEAVTGKNNADDNTGGSASIDTGNAYAGAAVDNLANFNWAHVEDCCELDGLIKVAGNGTESENDVDLEHTNFLGVYQDNAFECGRSGREWFDSLSFFGKSRKGNDCNDVEAKANSGDNGLDDNTGHPGVDPSIDTGSAATEVEVENTGNSNVFSTGDAVSQMPNWDMGSDGMNWFAWMMWGSRQG